MSRSHYSDDCDDDLAMGRWRGMVSSATRGKRGQQFFKDLLAALDAMPEKRLIAAELQTADGDVCAMGCLMRNRGIDATKIDETEPEEVAVALNIAACLAQEVAYLNDEWLGPREEPEKRWTRMREWAAKQITEENAI